MSKINVRKRESESVELTGEEIFIQGKKLFIVGDYSNALECLSKACKMLELKNGNLSDEMFEPYYYLGKGYYMYSKEDTELLNDAVAVEKEGNDEEKTSEENKEDGEQGDSKENDEQEKSKENDEQEKSSENDEQEYSKENEEQEKSKENDEQEKSKENDEQENSKENDEQEKSKENDEQEKSKENDEQEKSKESDEQENSNENDESDDVDETTEPSKRENLTYLQLAYETIECAKLILERRLKASTETNRKDIELKLADCCDIVGNIYMEECVISEAIGEFTRALDLRVKNVSDIAIERSIAESHFNLAMAHCVDSNPLKAIVDYVKCKDILETCKKRALDENDETTAKELSEIIADINERIVDCEEGERDYKLAKESIKELLGLQPSSDLPVSDVSHLVRRKNAGAQVSEEPPAKRMKESDASCQ